MRKARSAAVAAVFVALLFLPHAARGLPASDDTASDDTPPIVSYSIDGIAGTNDWFRGSTHGNNITLHWSVSDPESPIISTTGCDPAIQIPGPNTGTTRTCEATSDGGTTRITTRSLKIDADPPATTAAPSRPANSAGWYRAPLSVSWSGVDPTSGIASCHAPVSYNGPDTAGSNQTGSCTDNAGNSSSDTFTVRYDTVAPTTVATPSRAANGAGWYRAPLSIAWVGSDVTSGLAACSATLPYSGPDTGGTPEVGSCTDNAGNSSSDSFTVRYDTQAPNTVATPARPPNGAGWYRAPVAISWGGTDTLSGVDSCSSAVTYSGPDTTGVTRSGSCTDRAGNSSSDSVLLHYDATAPATTAAPSRPRQRAGWYRAPLSGQLERRRPDLRDRLLPRAGLLQRSRHGRQQPDGQLHGQRRQQLLRHLHRPLRHRGADDGGDAEPRSERRRLVPGAPLDRLGRERRDLWARRLQRHASLQRAGHGWHAGGRQLHGQRR